MPAEILKEFKRLVDADPAIKKLLTAAPPSSAQAANAANLAAAQAAQAATAQPR
jgi:hypothetical protein